MTRTKRRCENELILLGKREEGDRQRGTDVGNVIEYIFLRSELTEGK